MPASDKYLPEQKSNVVLWYAVCGDPKTVQHKFQAVYDKGEHHIEAPSEDQIKAWYKNFRHLGFVDVHDAEIHEEATGEPIPHVEQHQSKVGHVASMVLHKLNNLFLGGPDVRTFHPYHMELIKSSVEDWEERKFFAKTQLEHIHKWAPILRSMWFTGEAKFYLNGRVECNNLVYTNDRKPDETENLPHKIVKKYTPSKEPHVTVWAAMNSELIIGPFFFGHVISSETYKEILKKFVNELHQITSEKTEHPLFVQDDSKIHTNVEVADFLDNEFPNRWTGSCAKYRVNIRNTLYAKWPHHSNDLMPVNFFLWGYIKSRVYKTEVNDIDELKNRIGTAFKNITPDLLEEAVEEYKTRLERVVNTNGHLVDATVYGEEIDYQALKVWGTYAWPYM